ncbi:MAG: hypothetical protein RL497_3039 [Pseudomonadota bacterium]|jgi:predicted dehydrogenase
MGWRYDAQNDGVLTHAKAITQHEQLNLIAAVDPSSAARSDFNCYYPDVLTYTSLQEAAQEHYFEWIFLALPTELHFSAFNEALALKPRVIVCEKPLAPSRAEAANMVAQASAQGCILCVNYIRPYEPHCKKMFAFIRGRSWGAVQKIIVRYGKGIANSASHFIQLLVQEFGAPQRVRVIKDNKINSADPEPDFILEFNGASAIFLRFDYQCYSLSEMDFYLERGAIFYRALGRSIEYQEATPDALFPHIKRLQTVSVETTELMNYQRHALADFYHMSDTFHEQKNQIAVDAQIQAALDALAVIETLTAQLGTRE